MLSKCSCVVHNAWRLRNCFYNVLKIATGNCFSTKTPVSEINVVKSSHPDINIEHNSLDEFIWSKLERWPSKTALVCSVTGRTLTYYELHEISTKIGKALRWKLKLKSGTTVAVILPNSFEFPLILLGAIHADVIVTCINHVSTKDEIRGQLIASNAQVIFVWNYLCSMVMDVVGTISNNTIKIVSVDSLVQQKTPEYAIKFQELYEHDLPRVNIKHNLDDVFLMPFSGGTTGWPKGVQLTQKNIISNILQMQSPAFKLNRQSGSHQDVVPGIFPFCHVNGIVLNGLNLLNEGVKLVMIPQFKPDSFLKFLLQYRPSFLCCSSALVFFLLNWPGVKAEHMESLEFIISVASLVSSEDVQKFYEKTNGRIQILQGYGLTECSSITHMQSINLTNKFGSIGQLVPSTECKVVPLDDMSSIGLGPNISGEILIRGPQVMKGYFYERKSIKEIVINEGWLRTGDVGHYDNDKNFFVTDKIKSVIKVMGNTVAPGELERILRQHDDVEDVAVVGIPHPQLGEVPKGFIVAKNKTRINIEEVNNFLNLQIAEYKQLRGGLKVTKEIPRDSEGNALKSALKELK